ncbi:MAG: ArdC family protein [Methylocystis sp.]
MINFKFDIYQRITNQIIDAVEAGAGDFNLPWHRSDNRLNLPRNAATEIAYRGVNILNLWLAADTKGYNSGLWATFNQWTTLGAKIRSGEKAAHIIFYKEILSSNSDDLNNPKSCRIARMTPVFAAEQVDGFDTKSAALETGSAFDPSHEAEHFIQMTGANIIHGGSEAYYRPSTDTIHLPYKQSFTGSDTSSVEESYYSTLFHELTHYSGTSNRCDRNLTGRFGTSSYAMEELIAELGAAFLCSHFKISSMPRKDHAQYLSHWLSVMKSDSRAILTAASMASQAVDFLLQNKGP